MAGGCARGDSEAQSEDVEGEVAAEPLPGHVGPLFGCGHRGVEGSPLMFAQDVPEDRPPSVLQRRFAAFDSSLRVGSVTGPEQNNARGETG